MQDMQLFNSLGRRLEPFRPQEAGKVRLYTCGPTVYNHVHIGNLRTFLFEDFLRRSLRFLGFEVTMVMNLTDVDDKTIRGALAKGTTLDDFTGEYIESFFADLDTLGAERAEVYPRATRHIDEMIAMVQTLLDKGFAYRSEDGSIFFRITEDEDYGRLSGIDLSQVRQGSRVASDEYEKEDVRDFVLWKAAKEGEPDWASWESPWGLGRPGWHIECSAMSMKYLGESFDIHCGGVDNMFPHHENEIAQSESATGKTFVGTWLHSEHLIVDGQKMSKSLGNQFTLPELLQRGVDPRALRYLFIASHYRQKLNFTFESLGAAGAALRRLDEMAFRLASAQESSQATSRIPQACETLLQSFAAALADDLNASAAFAALFNFVKEVNKAIESGLGDGDRQRVQATLQRVDGVLGVIDPEPWKGRAGQAEAADGLSDAAIEEMLEQRREARRQRDFAAADRLRDTLVEAGIILEDTPEGTRWRRS